ncbi:unnamed protein product, partial [Rotaria sp. Silwood2]
RFHENVTDRAKNTKETTDIVLSQCTSKLPDSAHIRLPPLDHIKRTIQQHRKKNDLPQIVNDVDFSSVPVVLQSTKRNDTFLRIDTDSDYFEDNYIVRFRANGSRTRPLFTIEYWNAHERTNNSAEAWNRCIKCIFQCSHPTL